MNVVYPQVDLKEWCERHDIKAQERKCRNCGLLQKPTIPWASTEFRGLLAPEHDCGPDYQLVIGAPVSKTERDEWRELPGIIKSLQGDGEAVE